MAVAVPIVSKKSVSMKLKMVNAAATNPSVENTLPRSKSPRVAKLGVAVNWSGNSVTPMMRPIAAVNRMLMIRAPGTFLT